MNGNKWQDIILNQDTLGSNDFCRFFYNLAAEEREGFLRELFFLAERDIVPGGFRSYDLRIDSDRLPDHVVFYIGLKASLLIRDFAGFEERSFLAGIGQASDTARPSSSRIKRVYLNAWLVSGIDIIDLGITTTPDVYFAASYFLGNDIKAVINISASHNPAKDNGLKHCIRDREGFIYSISQEQMSMISDVCLKPEDRRRTNSLITENLITAEKEGSLLQELNDQDELAFIHLKYLKACAYLGREAMTELKGRFKEDFREVLNSIFELKRIDGEIDNIPSRFSWDEIKKQLKINADLSQPAFFRNKPLQGFHIVLDYAKGTGYRIAALYKDLGATVEELSEERGFNPLEEKNQKGLKKAVKAARIKYPEKEVVGLAHDEDADRLAVMRSDGKNIAGDRLLVLMAKYLTPFLAEHQGKKPLVVTEVKSRPETRKALSEAGVKVLVVPTGFAFIKSAAIEVESYARQFKKGLNEGVINIYGQEVNLAEDTSVVAWAELSGHFGFYQDFFNFFDNATLMALLILEIIENKHLAGSDYGDLLINLDQKSPSYPSSGELNLFVRTAEEDYVPTSAEKQKVVETLAEEFLKDCEVDKIDYTDGIQVTFKEDSGCAGGWILVRKSNNEDKLVLVTSAPDQPTLDRVERKLFTLAAGIHVFPITGLILTESEQQNEERVADPYIHKRVSSLI